MAKCVFTKKHIEKIYFLATNQFTRKLMQQIFISFYYLFLKKLNDLHKCSLLFFEMKMQKDSLSSSQLSNSLSNKLNDELLSSSGSVTELTHAGERAGDVKSTMVFS